MELSSQGMRGGEKASLLLFLEILILSILLLGALLSLALFSCPSTVTRIPFILSISPGVCGFLLKTGHHCLTDVIPAESFYSVYI